MKRRQVGSDTPSLAASTAATVSVFLGGVYVVGGGGGEEGKTRRNKGGESSTRTGVCCESRCRTDLSR